MYRNREGSSTVTPPVNYFPKIHDRLPLPDRSEFDQPPYQEVIKKNAGLRQTTLLVTRGCPFSCALYSKPVWDTRMAVAEARSV
ncbi:MAG: hypothetical protein WCF90_08270 [Methanomicrobiales archaeon]